MEILNQSPILTFFAHPDDETLAAGGTIKKLIEAGREVHIAIPNTGVFSRKNIISEQSLESDYIRLKEDTKSALKILGVKKDNIYFGSFPDNEIDKHSLLELIHWLERIIKKVKPKVIFTHHRFCSNIDHQYCHEAAVIASRPSTDNHITLICGEVPSSTGYLKPTGWDPNVFIELSEGQIISKIKAMEKYEGEARQDPHPRSKEVLRALAKVRGSESGFSFAESFMLHTTFM